MDSFSVAVSAPSGKSPRVHFPTEGKPNDSIRAQHIADLWLPITVCEIPRFPWGFVPRLPLLVLERLRRWVEFEVCSLPFMFDDEERKVHPVGLGSEVGLERKAMNIGDTTGKLRRKRKNTSPTKGDYPNALMMNTGKDFVTAHHRNAQLSISLQGLVELNDTVIAGSKKGLTRLGTNQNLRFGRIKRHRTCKKKASVLFADTRRTKIQHHGYRIGELARDWSK